MSEITQLQPQLLWKWFDKICHIPHPSYHENNLAEFIVQWAKSKGFFAERDTAGNVLIRKPAAKGMENKRGVVLQAHLDMVPQANETTTHNFETDPIQAYVDGEWVTAKGTTLGADNGIGMASALAILESDLPCGEIEVLLTMSEETGMEGAIGLRPNWLTHDLMINLDTEENGEIYVGCAGGENANISLPFIRENKPYTHHYQLTLKGLRGGHSGCDIHKNRGNAIKLMARFLAELHISQPEWDFTLREIKGGSIRNAIPREAFAILAFNGDVSVLTQAVETFSQKIKLEFAHEENNIEFNYQVVSAEENVLTPSSALQIINTLNVLPCGVMRQSDAVENTVETSLSIGVLEMAENTVNGIILIRSLIESGTTQIKVQLQSLMQLTGGYVTFSGYYPGWTPQPNSDLLNLTKNIYGEILGFTPEIKVIHAGLECGLLKKTYPNLEVVSIGPTIRNAHSPDEKVHIPAVLTYWELLTKVLTNMMEK